MNSDIIKKGSQRAPHRSLLRACGLNDMLKLFQVIFTLDI